MADSNLKIDTTLLDGLIVGRVEPHIYAFSTETVPNYLKVGDTARGVRVRLDEWRKIFPNLVQQYEHSAQIDDETIFRDFAVHTFLEHGCYRTRLGVCLTIQRSSLKGLQPLIWKRLYRTYIKAHGRKTANISFILRIAYLKHLPTNERRAILPVPTNSRSLTTSEMQRLSDAPICYCTL